MSKDRIHPDSKIIDRLGGPTKLANRLNYEKGGAQRVQNWRVRGIPPQVKIDHPDLFLMDLADRVRAMDDPQIDDPPGKPKKRTRPRKIKEARA